MKTGIVILNYNDYETTKEMLNTIKNYKSLDIIVVVDNHSTDRSFSKLKKYESKKIRVIKSKENKGYAYGNNYGIEYLIQNYSVDNIIISNPDISVLDKDIKMLVSDLELNLNIDLVAPYVDENGVISRGWKLPSYFDELLSNMNFVHRLAKKRMQYKDKHYQMKLSKVEVVSGCFFVIRRKSFQMIGLFDENTFLYYEENIIGNKLKKLGMNTYVDKDVIIKHNLSVSVDKSFNSLKKYKILKDSQKYYQKEYNNLNIFGMILLRGTYYISLFISYLICYIKNLGGKS